ncbi:MAG: phosphate ABC transporter substrate-binding protein [Candidatus Aminicenantes bacterium]
MRNRFMFAVLTAVLGVGLIIGANAFAAQKTITIKGSTTVLPIAQSCAEVFMNKHPDINISVQGGGSGVGIASLMDGTCDIGNASRTAKDKEKAKAKQKGIHLYENVVAMDGIAVIVHPTNPVDGLSKAQIKAVYTGEISNWSEVGGRDQKIVIVSRDSASGTFETFNQLALDKAKVRPDALLSASNRAVAMTVAKTPGAIGYVGLGYLGPSVKDLKVNGVEATEENVVNSSYSLARKLFMYTDGKPKGVVGDFIEFVLSSDGQKLVDRAGFVALQ